MKTIRRSISSVMCASPTARPAIESARRVLARSGSPSALYFSRVAARYDEFNTECRRRFVGSR